MVCALASVFLGVPAEAQSPTNLFVSSHFPGGPPGSASNAVVQFNGLNGSFANVFVQPGSGGLLMPHGLVYGPDNNFYVTGHQGSVIRYQNWGSFYDIFVPVGSGSLDLGGGMAFSPVDGNLYVTSYSTNSDFGDAIKVYDKTTGAFIKNLDTGSATGVGINGLSGPINLIFGPDTNLYVSSLGNDAVLRYNGITGVPMPSPGQTGAFFIGTNTLTYTNGGLVAPYGLRWTANGQHLLVASYETSQVKRYDTNGVFVDNFITVPASNTNGGPWDIV
jgi:hypothetical protein